MCPFWFLVGCYFRYANSFVITIRCPFLGLLMNFANVAIQLWTVLCDMTKFNFSSKYLCILVTIVLCMSPGKGYCLILNGKLLDLGLCLHASHPLISGVQIFLLLCACHASRASCTFCVIFVSNLYLKPSDIFLDVLIFRMFWLALSFSLWWLEPP